MDDLEIMALPEWDNAFEECVEQFKKENCKEPTLTELHNLIEVLIMRFRAVSYLRQKL